MGHGDERVAVKEKKEGGQGKQTSNGLRARLEQWSVWSPVRMRAHDATISRTGLPQTLDHSHLNGNLTNSKTAETNALEPLKS